MREHPDIRQFDSFATKAGGYEPVFNRNYAAAYELFSVALESAVDQLRKPVKVLDIGCGDGWTAAFLASLGVGTYVGIDTSEESVKALSARMRGYEALKAVGLHRSAKWLLTGPAGMQLESLLGGLPSLIVCNTVIHQLEKTQCDVEQIVCWCGGIIEPGGCFIVGDYYYPADVSHEEMNRTQQWIRKTTGQNPTARHVFWSPSELLRVLRLTDLEVSDCRTTQANASISLQYYIVTAWRRM